MEYSEHDIKEMAKGISIAPGEISDILGKPPRTIYLYSNLGIVLVIFIFVLSSFFIPYRTTLPFRVMILKTDSISKNSKSAYHDSATVIGFAPIFNAGTIKEKQLVNISLDAYPSADYGFLTGTVQEIKPFENKKEVEFIISLKSGFITSKQKSIPRHPVLTGNGTIIIKETSYFSRLFLH